MLRSAALLWSTLLCTTLLTAQSREDTLARMNKELLSQLTFQEGSIPLGDGVATLQVPEGFHYLDSKQSIYILSNIWGNPPDSSTLGMVFAKDANIVGEGVWAYEISYDPMGYVEDDDADDIDYDEMLETMQEESVETNKLRKNMGYPTVDIVGWAEKPYYDESNKVLHWAKNLRFEGEDENTLNYNVRVLGRKGVLVINAIASMNQLDLVKKNIPKTLKMASFNEGYRYSEFDPGIDEIAAVGIGGLVAGKVLAKAGIFAMLAKFIGPALKPLLLGIAAFGAGIWRWITGRRRKPEDETPSAPQPPAEPEAPASAPDETPGT